MMTEHNDGGPAFPACNEANINDTMGMTLRDWFAGQALAGLLANGLRGSKRGCSQHAYMLADAMIAERGEK